MFWLGVAIVGDVPGGLPAPTLPLTDLGAVVALLPDSWDRYHTTLFDPEWRAQRA